VGAKRASHASALLSVIVGAIVMITLMAFKDVRSWYCEHVAQGIHAFSVGFWLHFQQRGGRRAAGQQSDASGRIVSSRKPTFSISCLSADLN